MRAFALLALTILPVMAEPRYVTLTVRNFTGQEGNRLVAELPVSDFEVAEIVAYHGYGQLGVSTLEIVKDGISMPHIVNSLESIRDVSVIAGPGIIRLKVKQNEPSYGICTVRISPGSSPPDRSVIILPGPSNGAIVQLEASTNLVDWVPAQSGAYTNEPVARFFRIRADRIQQ
jgi:hypothetical protein